VAALLTPAIRCVRHADTSRAGPLFLIMYRRQSATSLQSYLPTAFDKSARP
jgi:hypothetical protein